jgi:hypothetical protein
VVSPDNPSSLAFHVPFDFKRSLFAKLANPTGCLNAVSLAGVGDSVAMRRQPWHAHFDASHW